jgi:hypothetical protein
MYKRGKPADEVTVVVGFNQLFAAVRRQFGLLERLYEEYGIPSDSEREAFRKRIHALRESLDDLEEVL